MRRNFSLVLIMIFLFNLLFSSAVFALRGNPYIWLELEDVYSANAGYVRKSIPNSSGGAVLSLDTTTANEVYEVSYSFTLTNEENYDIYLLSTPNDMAWCSRYQWSLNKEEYTYSGTNLGQAYITEDNRKGGISWYKLTNRDLKAGRHSISFAVKEMRATAGQFYYHILDTLVVVPSSWNWMPSGLNMPIEKSTVNVNCVGGSISAETAERESTIHIEASYKSETRILGGSPKIYAELALNGETVSRVEKSGTISVGDWDLNQIYRERFEIPVPFNAPDGIYEVRTGVAGMDSEDSSIIGTVRIGVERKEIEPFKAEVKNLTAAIENSRIKGTANVELLSAVHFDTSAYVTLWKDDILWGVVDDTNLINTSLWEKGDEMNIVFDAALPVNLPEGHYEARVGIHSIDVESPACAVSTTKNSSERYKPLSYGNYYAKVTGKNHFWYVNQSDALIWGGKPYIPFGGMFCSTYIHMYDISKPEANKRNFEVDKADLALLKEAGIKDLYINTVSNAADKPVWAWNFFLDYLEQEGFTYGIQPNIHMFKRSINAYYPRANDEIPNAFKVDGIKESGKATLTFTGTPKSALFTVIDNATQTAVQSGKAGLEEQSGGTYLLTADVEVDTDGEYSVYFAPETETSVGTLVNFWDHSETILSAMETFNKRLITGDNFRLFVDPIANEMGFYNATETARINSPNFDVLFEKYLENKYGSLSELSEAWSIEPMPESFKESALLVPVYTTDIDENGGYFTYYMNPKTEKLYRANTRNGLSWNDYLDCRDDEFLKFNNIVADVFKSKNNVPVVYKHVSVQRRYFINKNLKGGFDGIGSETYGPIQTVENKMAMASAHADQSARTTWTIVTETNTEENIKKKLDSGDWAYPSEEYWINHLNSLFAVGAKGIYDFLLSGRHDTSTHNAYSYMSSPQMMEWYKNYSKNLMTKENIQKITSQKYFTDVFYFYPSDKNWWYNPNERTVVQYKDDTSGIKRLRTDDGFLVPPTDDVTVNCDVIFINLINGPYTQIFGKGVSSLLGNDKSKRVVVLGHRNDLGSLPEIDQYYTDEKVEIEGTGTVQILKPTDTSQILYSTEDGKPWALRDGELWIIANSEFYDETGENWTLRYISELGITDVSTIRRTEKTSLFTDMASHWAKNDVEEMARMGLVNGVGNKMFDPNSQMTKEHFILFMNRIIEKPEFAYDYNLINELDRPITREEAAYIISTALELSKSTPIDNFADSNEVSNWALESFERVYAAGIMKGISDNLLSPKGELTRAEAAAVVKRSLTAK